MASAKFEEIRNSSEAVSIYCIWIHFDAFFDIPAKDFYFSSSENIDLPVNDVIQTFLKGYMKDIPKGRHQKDRDNDYCEFSLFNGGNRTYQDFRPYENIIERGEIVIYHCLELERDLYEGEIRFVGYLKDFTIAESDKSLRFTAFSDLSRKGFQVGNRILTRERCGTEFNFGGTHPPDAPRPCTWQTIQGGNPDFCSKFLKGTDGCIAHGNAHQFFAVTALSKATIEFVNSQTIDFPYENNPCFTANNFIINANGSVEPISFARVGQIIKGRDLFTGEVVNTEILEVPKHVVEVFAKAKFSNGAVLEATTNHLFRVNKNSFYAPLGALKGKTVLGMDISEKDASNRLDELETIKERTIVYNLRTTCHTYIVADMKRTFYFDVHNNKNHIPIDS